MTKRIKTKNKFELRLSGRNSPERAHGIAKVHAPRRSKAVALYCRERPWVEAKTCKFNQGPYYQAEEYGLVSGV